MLDGILQQFVGGEAESMGGPELHGNVHHLVQHAPPQHVSGAISDALGALGAGGFGQSIEQAAMNGGPQQRGGIANLLTGAIEQGGGSSGGILQALGMGGQSPSSFSPQQLGQLGQYVHQNHSSGLVGLLTSQLSGGSGGGGSSGILSLLGNPMVRQVGMQLASRLMH